MKRRVLSFSLALATAGAVLPVVTHAAAPQTADPDAVLRYATPGVVQSMDPRTANEYQRVFLDQAYEPLIRNDADGTLVPGLALQWELVDDGAAFELTLRDGVTFQDGEAFDAAAVVANIEHDKENGHFPADLAVIDSVTAPDETTVRMELNGPGGHLPGVLAGYAGMMISPPSLEEDLQTSPAGAGPFELVEATESTITFARWDGYYDADNVSIGGIEFQVILDENARIRALEAGQIDGGILGPSQVAQAEAAGLNVEPILQSNPHSLLVNSSNEIFAEAGVRQAIMHAIDRETISQVIYDGHCLPTAQPYGPDLWAHNPDLVDSAATTYDPDLARELLAEAGYEDGFSAVLSTYPATIYGQVSQVLQSQLGEVGIDLEVDVATDLTTQRRAGDFDVIFGPVEAARPDPTVYYSSYYDVDGPLNFGSLEFAGLDELIGEARASTDTAERAAAVHELIALTVEQGPLVIPVCIPEMILTTRPNITGIVGSVLGTRDYRAVQITS